MAVRYQDLTLVYGGSTWSQPFLFDRPVIEPIHTHAEHGRSNTYFGTSCHLGTHIDAPSHFVEGGSSIDHVDIGDLIGDAIVLDLRNRSKGGGPALSVEKLDASRDGRKLAGNIIVIFTGWLDEMFGSDEYYGNKHPYLSPATADWLVGHKPKALMVDTGIDPVEPPRQGDNPAHRAILGAGIPLIENFTNLSTLPRDGFRIFALPLCIAGSDGAPARVVAELRG